jgi:hypothetical protein
MCLMILRTALRAYQMRLVYMQRVTQANAQALMHASKHRRRGQAKDAVKSGIDCNQNHGVGVIRCAIGRYAWHLASREDELKHEMCSSSPRGFSRGDLDIISKY